MRPSLRNPSTLQMRHDRLVGWTTGRFRRTFRVDRRKERFVPRPILFLSDLGVRDEFVGVCHSVIASIAPDAPVIDLSHGVPPQDIQAGAMTFRDCIAFAPQDGVLLGVVDPGVGTDRKAIAVETTSRTDPGRARQRAALAGVGRGGRTDPRVRDHRTRRAAAPRLEGVPRARRVRSGGGAPGGRSSAREARARSSKTDELVSLTTPRGRHPHRRDPRAGARRRPLRQRSVERPSGRPACGGAGGLAR